MKVIKKIAIALLVILIGLQFYRPTKNESAYSSIVQFEKETSPPDNVKAILKNNCYDCHSNTTTYPWYSEVAPISLWINDHIEEGKEHFNVSNWGTYSLKKKDHKLEELIEEVEEGKMPEDAYTWIHGTLEDGDKQALIEWAKKARKSYNVH